MRNLHTRLEQSLYFAFHRKTNSFFKNVSAFLQYHLLINNKCLKFSQHTLTNCQLILLLSFQGASRPSHISTFNCDFICEHLLFVQYKTNKKNFPDFIIFFSRIFKILQNLYINLACLSVYLFVCLYPINVKTAEPIGPKFCVGSRVTPAREGL